MKPLDDVKVLDLSWVVAGPLVGRALADAGATVVRVETGTRLETARLMPPYRDGVPDPENAALYGNCNAGKLGVALDLRRENARNVVRRLARWADVVLESYAPGRMAAWGLDYDSLSADDPGLIMVSSSIYGQDGPYCGLAGYGNVGAALSGFQAAAGWPDRMPLGPFGPYTDYVAPRFALATLLAALARRARTGEGAYIDISQVEAGAYLQAPYIARNAVDGSVVERAGNADPASAPHGVFACAGTDRYLALTVHTDEQWRLLATVMNAPELADDERFTTTAQRLAHRADVEAVVGAWTRSHRAEELQEILQRLRIPAHIAADSRDFCEDEQLAFRRHLVELPHPRKGTTTVEGPRYLLSDTPLSVERAAPTIGQHTTTVLTDILGMSTEDIADLEREGALA